MPQAVDNIALALEQIGERLLELEHRVATLEARYVILSGESASRSEALAESKDPYPVVGPPATDIRSSETRLQRPRPPATWRGFPPIETPSGVVPILGKAVLGIAGAYLLRAIAESSSVPDWQVWIVAITAALCYGVGASTEQDQDRRRLLWVTPAALVGFTAAALAIAVIVGLASRHFELAASSLSVIRTVVICVVALTLGFLGSLQRRIELAWLAYAAVALGTLKLLVEDLRFGNAASLVVSLLFYGLILILLPRVTKRRESAYRSVPSKTGERSAAPRFFALCWP